MAGLLIRKEQMKILEIATLRRFEDEMVQHVKNIAPIQFDVTDEEGVRRFVRMGIERAEAYGFTNRGPVRFYIELMLMFGCDFDSDPQYAWAGEILNEEGNDTQMEKADRLYDKTMEFLEKIAGPGYIYEKTAMRKATQSPFEDLPSVESDFERDLTRYLTTLYPQKTQGLGPACIGSLIQVGQELARQYGVSQPSGISLFICLMFAFGHGCFSDPQFSWIGGTLRNESITDPNKKMEQLYSKTMTHLSRALSLME